MENTTHFRAAFSLASAAVFGSLSAPVMAQDTASGTSTATVYEPVQIVNTSDLDFGSIIPNGTGVGRVRINARNGNRNTNVNVEPYGTTGFGRALFTVTGEPRAFVNLTTTTPVITLTGPGAPMTVDRLRVSRNGGGQRELPHVYRIPLSGSMTIGFGGRLRVDTNQAPGFYTGNFDLIVTYQ